MDESALVEEISRLERMKSAAAAGQARAAAALDQLRRANEGAAGVALGQAGLWRGQRGGVGAPRFTGAGRPPSRIRQSVGPRDAAYAGCLEWGARATLIVRESACLDVENRRLLDAELCSDVTKLDGMGDARVAAAAKEIACRLDVQAVVDRAAKAEEDRTVTIRPAPDTMTYVTALLPVAKGVGVYAALNKTVDVKQQS